MLSGLRVSRGEGSGWDADGFRLEAGPMGEMMGNWRRVEPFGGSSRQEETEWKLSCLRGKPRGAQSGNNKWGFRFLDFS